MKKQDLLKIVKKETKDMEKFLSIDDNDQLVLKINNKTIKEALKIDPETKQLTEHFKDEYKNKINDIRKYSMVDAESFLLVFDEKVSIENKQTFLIAWSKYFATSIVRQNQDHKKLKRRMLWYLLAGILTLLIYTAIQICAIKYLDTVPAMKYVAVCFESLLIVAWVFLWNFCEMLIEDIPASKAKLLDLYLMYKGNGEISKNIANKPKANVDGMKVEAVGGEIKKTVLN